MFIESCRAYETIDHRNDVIPDDTVYVFACAPDFQTFFKLSILLYNDQPPLFLAPYYMNYTNSVIKMFKTHRLHFGRKIHCMQFLVHHAHFHVVADNIGSTNSCIIIKFILSCIKIVYISRVFLFSSYFLTTSAENCLSERHEAQKLRLWLLAIYKFEGLQIHAHNIISSCQFLIVVLTK